MLWDQQLGIHELWVQLCLLGVCRWWLWERAWMTSNGIFTPKRLSVENRHNLVNGLFAPKRLSVEYNHNLLNGNFARQQSIYSLSRLESKCRQKFRNIRNANVH